MERIAGAMERIGGGGGAVHKTLRISGECMDNGHLKSWRG